MFQNPNYYYNNQSIQNNPINQLTLQQQHELYYKKMMADFYQAIEPRLQYIPINCRATYLNVAWQCYINGEMSSMRGSMESKQYTPLHEINDKEYLIDRSTAQITNEIQHKDKPLPLLSSIEESKGAIEVERSKIPAPFKIIKIRKGNKESVKNKNKELKQLPSNLNVNETDCTKPFIRNKRNRTTKDGMNNTANNDTKIIDTIKLTKVNKGKKTFKEQANELMEDSFLFGFDKTKKININTNDKDSMINSIKEEKEKGNESSDSSTMMIYYGDHYQSTQNSIDFMKYNFNFEHHSHYTTDRLITDIESQHVTIFNKEFMLLHNPDSLILDSINLNQMKKTLELS